MSRVLVFSHALEIGGAERALLGLLDGLLAQGHEVDLFLMRHAGELMPYVPGGVRLLPELPQYASLAVPVADVLRAGRIRVAWRRVLGKAAAARRVRELGLPPDNDVALDYSHRYALPCMPPVGDGEYDLAVSFLTPHWFVAERVRARRKVAWIHTDYSCVSTDAQAQLAMWEPYDRIVSISEDVSRAFASAFPSLADRLVLVPNIVPADLVRRMAEEFDATPEMPEDGTLRMLSVGRFCHAKNFDSVPDICRRLLALGVDATWYLIGYGGDEELIRNRIAEAGMEGRVVVLGKRENPYPYMCACDLYVQPSRYEGKCVAVQEAQALGKPVVITAYPTAASQLTDGVDGVVVPLDNQGCAEGIAHVARDREFVARLGEAAAEGSGELVNLVR